MSRTGGPPRAPDRPTLAAIVLAAGAGTRLRPLTELRPKALCPVGDRPLVDWVIDRVTPHVADIAVNVHHHREQLQRHLDGMVHLSVEEPAALGTAGAVANLRGWLGGRAALVANADAWTRDDLADLVAGWDGERVRLLVVEDPSRGDFGSWRYAGACLLPWRVVAALPDTPAGLYETCWRVEAAAGRLDYAPSDTRFIDCGTPAGYLAANLDWSGGRTVVGAGAVVEGRAERCVIWPGAHVAAHESLREVIRVGSTVTVQAGA